MSTSDGPTLSEEMDEVKQYYKEFWTKYKIEIIVGVAAVLFLRQHQELKRALSKLRPDKATNKAILSRLDLMSTIMMDHEQSRDVQMAAVQAAIEQGRKFDHYPGLGVYIHAAEQLTK